MSKEDDFLDEVKKAKKVKEKEIKKTKLGRDGTLIEDTDTGIYSLDGVIVFANAGFYKKFGMRTLYPISNFKDFIKDADNGNL